MKRATLLVSLVVGSGCLLACGRQRAKVKVEEVPTPVERATTDTDCVAHESSAVGACRAVAAP